VYLCVSSRVAAVHLGGGITLCAMLMTSSRANVKNNKYKDVYGLDKAFAPAIVDMSEIHADFLRLLWVLADKQLRSCYESMSKRIRSELRLFDGRGPRFSTPTRLQLVGPLPLAVPPAACSQPCDATLGSG